MKKLFVAALASSALLAVPAFAQNVSSGNTLTYNLDADVGVICGVYNTGGQTVAIAFDDLAETRQGVDVIRTSEAVYRCNSAAGFTREISSLNDGKLVRAGNDVSSNNEIAYRFGHGGATGAADLATRGNVPLSRPLTNQYAGSTTFLTGAAATVTFAVPGVFNNRSGRPDGAPGTTVFAGDYSDTVSITVNAR